MTQKSGDDEMSSAAPKTPLPHDHAEEVLVRAEDRLRKNIPLGKWITEEQDQKWFENYIQQRFRNGRIKKK